MFWRKKNQPPPLPQKLSDGFKNEMAKQLEMVGAGKSDDVVTAGIGMIKMGAKELVPGWLSEFGKAKVFLVSIGLQPPQKAFVMGPDDDRNYLAVFTRLDFVDECIREMPPLDTAMTLTGIEVLEHALNEKWGIWINPLSEAFSVRFPANIMERFIEMAQRV